MFPSLGGSPSKFSKSLFGQPGTSAFGSQPQQSSTIFGTVPQNPFTQTVNNNEPNNGNKIFGSNTSNLFGNTNQFCFGQMSANKPLNQMETNSNHSGINFATNTQNSQGTMIKYIPVKTTDSSVYKGGLASGNIMLHSITCMKEYENKSFEELRLEDYLLNQKGAQTGHTNIFSKLTAVPQKPVFGIEAHKPIYSQASTGTTFGQSIPGTSFGQTAQGTSFGQTAAGVSFGQTAPGTSFGQTAPGLNFGQTALGGSFGQTAPSASFGQANSFLNTEANKSIFNNAATSFSANASATSNLPFGPNLQHNLFQSSAQNPFLKQPGTNFGQTIGAQPTFGSNQPTTTNQNTGLFGQNTNLFTQNKTSPFKLSAPSPPAPTGTAGAFPNNKPATLPTANFNYGKLCGSSSTNATSMFGQNQKPFASTSGYLGASLGVGGSNFLMNQSFVPNASTNTFPSYPTVPQTNPHEQILALAATPYGLSDLLNNISSSENQIEQYKRITNPDELGKILKSVRQDQLFTKKEKLSRNPITKRRDPTFEGLEFLDESLISNTRLNYNPKRLIIPNKNFSSSSEIMRSIFETEKLEKEKDASNFKSRTGESTDDSAIFYDTMCELREVNIIDEEVEKNNNDEGSIVVQDTLIQVEDIEDNSSSSEPCDIPTPHPTGIVLTRPQYYTLPPLDELVKYLNKDGSCFVQGFTIGRYGYGNVHFPEAFDISNLNLDEIVHFRHKEITIYPDDSNKPPLGEGLNRRAQITLDKVWPKDKQTKKVISDVKVLESLDYTSKLRKICDKQGFEFVDYRPDTGSWVFKVTHF